MMVMMPSNHLILCCLLLLLSIFPSIRVFPSESTFCPILLWPNYWYSPKNQAFVAGFTCMIVHKQHSSAAEGWASAVGMP